MASISNTLTDQTLISGQAEISIPAFLQIDPESSVRKEEMIYCGKHSEVYKGVIVDPNLKQKFPDQNVAMKRIFDRPGISNDESTLLFKLEIAAMWALSSHPNVVKLIGYSENPKTIISTYYPKDLRKLLDDPLTELDSFHIYEMTLGLVSAFMGIHDSGIVHKDLKPRNILVQEKVHTYQNRGQIHTRKSYSLQVCDFGIARIHETHLVDSQIEQVQVFGFSIPYAAPEVFSRRIFSASDIDIELEKATDVYSFAIVLWEMLTREKAWNGFSEKEIEQQVRAGNRPPLSLVKFEREEKYANSLISIVELAWSQNPYERPTFVTLHEKLSKFCIY